MAKVAKTVYLFIGGHEYDRRAEILCKDSIHAVAALPIRELVEVTAWDTHLLVDYLNGVLHDDVVDLARGGLVTHVRLLSHVRLPYQGQMRWTCFRRNDTAWTLTFNAFRQAKIYHPVLAALVAGQLESGQAAVSPALDYLAESSWCEEQTAVLLRMAVPKAKATSPWEMWAKLAVRVATESSQRPMAFWQLHPGRLQRGQKLRFRINLVNNATDLAARAVVELLTPSWRLVTKREEKAEVA